MARALHKLNDAKVRAASNACRLSDGGGLYLRVSNAGSKSWSYMWNQDGNRTEYGLGPYQAVSLSLARSKASECREAVARGQNLKTLFEKAPEKTFAECVRDFSEKNEKAWSNPKHRDQWEMTLGPAYCAKLQKKRPSEITKSDVLAVLNIRIVPRASRNRKIQDFLTCRHQFRQSLPTSHWRYVYGPR